MSIFRGFKKTPEHLSSPEQRKWVYCVLTEGDDLQRIEAECHKRNLFFGIGCGEDGEKRIYFYKEDQKIACEVMGSLREGAKVNKRPDETKSIDCLIENANSVKERNLQLKAPEARMTKQVKAIEEGNTLHQELQCSHVRNGRKSSGRTHQIMTRLTDAECAQFQSRVKKSGLAQGEYLRRAALSGQIVVEERSMVDVAALDDLAMIRAELGRQGGLLKMLIRPNEGRRELAPEEWGEVIGAIRYMEKTQKRIADLEVKLLHGNRNA